jgi:hypothetical protein
MEPQAKKDVAGAAAEASGQCAGDDRAAPSKKPYKSPTISRHGNLRLMTQLE